MKKTLFLLLWILLATGTYALTPIKIDSVHYTSTSLVQNSFASLRLGVATWQGSDRNPAGNYRGLNPVKFNYGVSVGKWVTHSFGVRLSYDANPGRSYIMGRHVMQPNYGFLYGENPQPDVNDYYRTSFYYSNIHAEVMLDPVDLFKGFFEADRNGFDKRICFPFLYFGFGAGCVHDKALFLFSKHHNYEFTTNFGAQVSFRANKYIYIDASVNGSKMRYSIDTWCNEFDGTVDGKRYKPGNDYNYTFTLGVSYYFQGIKYKRL